MNLITCVGVRYRIHIWSKMSVLKRLHHLFNFLQKKRYIINDKIMFIGTKYDNCAKTFTSYTSWT